MSYTRPVQRRETVVLKVVLTRGDRAEVPRLTHVRAEGSC